MAYQFRKHYTRDEARLLLPQIRLWLRELAALRARYAEYEQEVAALMETGNDVGGVAVNGLLKAFFRMREILAEFHHREIQIKDVDRGLLDFPSLMGSKEVFLCWEMDEDDIEFWHDLDTGFAGREKL